MADRYLVICEKPSVAKDVAKALSGTDRFERKDWGYEGSTYWVTAAAGHLVAEAPPDAYDDRYKTWAFADLPILPDTFIYQPRDDRAADRLETIKGLVHDPSITVIVNACDAGREGEHIFKLLAAAVHTPASKTIRRAWFSSMTEQAIRDAFSNLLDDNTMKPLEEAAKCRSMADWFVGMNATRAATTTLGGSRTMISLGRVQTPTLALIVNRDLTIEHFVPEDFATLTATFTAADNTYVGRWRSDQTADAADRFPTEAEAKVIEAAVKAAGTGTVVSVDVRNESVSPPALFDLTGLQREANTRFGMTAAETLAAAQACYETHKVLTYPRTDSSYITADMQSTIPQLVKSVGTLSPEFKVSADQLTAAGVDGSALVNDAKVTDHHGLLPVAGTLNLSGLSPRERNIFDLVVWRMLAALGDPQLVERTIIYTKVPASGGDVWFRTAGKVEISPGWKAHWPKSNEKKEPDDDDQVCKVDTGQQVDVAGTDVKLSKTKPPAAFTESSLLGQMASAGKLVDDSELSEAMKESGLGTPATRAATIEKLISTGYVERSGKKLIATAKGRGAIIALGDHPLTRADLTGTWEKKLRDIERATPDEAASMSDLFTTGVKAFTTDVVASFSGLTADLLAAGRKKLADCPNSSCNGGIVAGQRGWGCTSWKSREEPGCGMVIWAEQSGKKVTEKQMLKMVADMAAGKIPLPTPPVPAVEIADCPTAGCGGKIVTRAKSYSCNSWKGPKDTGCGFVIWRNVGRDDEVDETKAKEMVSRGETNGASAAPAIADCPTAGCGGKIVTRAKSYSCNSWKGPKDTGCGFVIWRNVGRDDEVDETEAVKRIAAGTSDAKPTFADCPKKKCNGKIIDRGKLLGCSSWKPGGGGCGTVLYRSTKDGKVKSDDELLLELASM